MGFKLLIGISKCCVTQRGGDTHAPAHTLTHTSRSGLKGEATLSSQKLPTSEVQGFLIFLLFFPSTHGGAARLARGRAVSAGRCAVRWEPGSTASASLSAGASRKHSWILFSSQIKGYITEKTALGTKSNGLCSP